MLFSWDPRVQSKQHYGGGPVNKGRLWEGLCLHDWSWKTWFWRNHVTSHYKALHQLSGSWNLVSRRHLDPRLNLLDGCRTSRCHPFPDLLPILSRRKSSQVNSPLSSLRVISWSSRYLIIPGVSLLFVFLSILVALYLAFTENHLTSFYCGRKAAFGEGFGTFIYCCNITCNVASTIFATAAYFKALNLSKTQWVHKQGWYSWLYYFQTQNAATS